MVCFVSFKTVHTKHKTKPKLLFRSGKALENCVLKPKKFVLGFKLKKVNLYKS